MPTLVDKSGQASGKACVAARLRSIRVEVYGEDGAAKVARQLGLPTRTWLNYESGVTIPSEIMLRYVIINRAEPLWLLEGVGPKYRELTTPSR